MEAREQSGKNTLVGILYSRGIQVVREPQLGGGGAINEISRHLKQLI